MKNMFDEVIKKKLFVAMPTPEAMKPRIFTLV